ncbi:MFS transporter [Bacillus horti]|uniref:FHS family glucose/mannose:H+ symporter-like MFS transporter n=1 Tax=Caldalkalibacillus horti TaxID=77523 RepID=A0ABT9VYB3_9BACI|nr:MFS transporter [Bacillus horti]MDQ0165984.1 FHS family glucose/mannose:H+ symporter-like MFS transporter [Bacillus horti]
MRRLIWMSCFAYLLAGFGHIIIGTVLEPMIEHYNLDYSDGGQLIMNQFLGFLVGVLFAPMIIKKIGRKATLFIALFLFAVVQLGLFLLLPWTVLLLLVPLGGAGFGMIETVLAGMIIAELKEKKASIMVLTELFFGIGALTVPIMAAVFIATGYWNSIFMAVSIIVMIGFVLWLFLRFGEYESILNKKPVNIKNNEDVIPKVRYAKPSIPLLWIGSLFFFLYVGVEMTFPNYLPSILSMTSTLSASTLALSITVFWGAMTLGRLIMIFIVDRIGIWKLFLITVTGQMITLGLFAMSPNTIISFITIFLAGFIMGGIFALGLLVINTGIPGLEDRTTSLLIAMGGLGGALLPRLAGSLLDNYPVEVTLWVLFGFAVIMTFLMSIIYRLSKKLYQQTVHKKPA